MDKYDTQQEQQAAERRRFLKTVGKAAVAAPAVALLLSVDKASAGVLPGPPDPYERR